MFLLTFIRCSGNIVPGCLRAFPVRHRWSKLEISRVMYLREQGLKPSEIAPKLCRAYRKPHNVSQIIYQVKKRCAWQPDMFVTATNAR